MKKQELLNQLKKLYEFIEQGSICACEEDARATFEVVKYRIELLFAEYFEVVKA